MTHVYIAKTDILRSQEVFLQKYNSAPPARKAKIDRLRLDSDKRRSLGAWLLLEHALRINGVDDTEMVYNDLGKPFLKNRPDVFFNLSHSGESVMCALSDAEVGCDVEAVAPINLKIAERFFHPDEVKAISALASKEEKEQMFYRIWTLKESFVKALGEGITLPLRSFSFDLSGETKINQQLFPDKQFYFKEYFINDGNRYAVCSLEPSFSEIETVIFD